MATVLEIEIPELFCGSHTLVSLSLMAVQKPSGLLEQGAGKRSLTGFHTWSVKSGRDGTDFLGLDELGFMIKKRRTVNSKVECFHPKHQ